MKRKSSRWLMVLSALVVAGCATPSPQEQARIAAITSRAAVIPECNTDALCKEYWERAVYFVANYAGRKIQTQTDTLVQTYNPSSNYGMEIAMSVNKVPVGGGMYKIIAKVWCNNPFGCYENPDVVLGLFNEFVETARLGGNKVL